MQPTSLLLEVNHDGHVIDVEVSRQVKSVQLGIFLLSEGGKLQFGSPLSLVDTHLQRLIFLVIILIVCRLGHGSDLKRGRGGGSEALSQHLQDKHGNGIIVRLPNRCGRQWPFQMHPCGVNMHILGFKYHAIAACSNNSSHCFLAPLNGELMNYPMYRFGQCWRSFTSS